MSPTTPIAPTAWPAVVEDRRRDARLAEHRLVALARDAALADRLELGAQRRGGERAAGQLRQRLGESGRRPRRRARTRASPCPARSRAPAAARRPRAPGTSRRAGRRGARRRRSGRACTPTRTAACARAASRSACTIERAAQLVEVEVGVAELQQPGAELVLVRVAVLLDEAVRLQRLQQPVDGRARQAEPVGELGHAEPARARSRAPSRMRAARSTDWIVPRVRRVRSFAIRHCRIHFDRVE